MHQVLQKFKKGLIVSCQAYPGDPMYGQDVMGKMALAAKMGGAVGIRANGHSDIQSIKKHVQLPVIGIVKMSYSDSEVYITPTLAEVKELGAAGAEMIALDATRRSRPNGETLEQLVAFIHEELGLPIMGDVSTLEEALYAESLGIEAVAPTLSGYTPYTMKTQGPDWALIDRLITHVKVPVIAEGRIETPKDAQRAIVAGCLSVVVGTAITRPEVITARFYEQIHAAEAANHVERYSR